jgi:hypothetical protein
MGMSEFRQITEAFCKEGGIGNSLSIIKGEAFSIHGCLAWLHYLPDMDVCRVVLDLGQPKHGFPPTLLRMMLEFNCANASRYLPSLGLNEKDGHALLMLHPPISILRKETSLFTLLEIQLKPVIDAWLACFEAVEIDDLETPVLLDRGFV